MGNQRLVIAGLVGTIFGLACSDAIKDGVEETATAAPTAAGPASCAQWEVQVHDGQDDAAQLLEAGWEPYGFSSDGLGNNYALRRCAD